MKELRIFVEDEYYWMYIDLLNRSSHNPGQSAFFGGEVFSDGVLKRKNDLKKDWPELDARARLRIIDLETRQQEDDQSTLNAIVSRNISEDAADKLHGVVMELELDDKAAAKFAQSSPFASTVAYSTNGTQRGRCMRWMAEFFTDAKGGIPRSFVVERANGLGFSENLANRASRDLGIIKLKGEGGNWYWYPPKVNNNNDNNNDAP